VIEVSECVVCSGPIRKLRRALVAPFLSRRIWNRASFCVDLVKCAACGFLFYNPRPEDAELQRLYTDYRLDAYQRMRHASEPWYTPQFNADLASPESYRKRRAILAPLLRQQLGGEPSGGSSTMAATAAIWWPGSSKAPKPSSMTSPASLPRPV
jgi:hypothetical protein